MVFGVILIFAYEKTELGSLLVVAASLPTLILGIKEMVDVGGSNYTMAGNTVAADLGIGLYLVVAGAVVAILGALAAMVRTKKTTGGSHPPLIQDGMDWELPPHQ